MEPTALSEWTAQTIPELLIFALPGFLALWVFYQLTPYPRAGQFEKVIQALILTGVLQTILSAAALWKPLLSHEGFPYLLAPVVGLGLAWVSNKDWPHKPLRWLGCTSESSRPSPWVGAMETQHDCYVICNLNDGRRICGWPAEWPNQPDQDHFYLCPAMWVDEQGQPGKRITAMLVPAEDVSLLEFVESGDSQESQNVQDP